MAFGVLCCMLLVFMNMTSQKIHFCSAKQTDSMNSCTSLRLSCIKIYRRSAYARTELISAGSIVIVLENRSNVSQAKAACFRHGELFALTPHTADSHISVPIFPRLKCQQTSFLLHCNRTGSLFLQKIPLSMFNFTKLRNNATENEFFKAVNNTCCKSTQVVGQFTLRVFARGFFCGCGRVYVFVCVLVQTFSFMQTSNKVIKCASLLLYKKEPQEDNFGGAILSCHKWVNVMIIHGVQRRAAVYVQ